MGHRAVVIVLVCCLLLSSACFAGPWKMSRSWQDKTADWYSNNAWVHGALLTDIIPAYPIVNLFLVIGDVFVNFWYFWSNDAWTNKGTVLIHDVPSGPNTIPNIWTDGSGGDWGSKRR
jgi:hypothetical protein